MNYYWVRFKNLPSHYEHSEPQVAFYDYRKPGRYSIVHAYFDSQFIADYGLDELEVIGPILLEDTLRRNQEQEAESIAAYERGEYVHLDTLIQELKGRLDESK